MKNVKIDNKMLKKVKKKSKMGKNGWQVLKATVDIQECVQGHVDG